MVDVFLINPPPYEGVSYVREGRCMQRKGAWTTVWPPISLVSIAAVLEKAGYDIRFKDFTANPASLDEVRESIQKLSPKVIVINTSTPSIEGDLAIAKMAKEIDPRIFTIAEGVQVTALPREMMELQPALDACIIGEPEETTGELVDAIVHKKEISKVKGISFRRKKEITITASRPSINDLDALPFPARHLLDLDKYRLPFTGKKFTTVIVARGCPFRCIFCAGGLYYGKRFRFRSPDNIIKELKEIKEKFGIDEFLFWSDTFTANKKWGMQVCQRIIDEKLNIRWTTNSRVDTIDKEFLNKMKEAGCWMLGFGIESGNQQILDNCEKGTTIEQAVNAIKLCKEVGIKSTGHFIFGLVGETEETIRNTITFAKKIDPNYAQFYCAIPYPGTKFREIALEGGWVVEKPWKFYEQNYSMLKMNDLTPEKIMKLRSKAYREFYFRPSKIVEHLLAIRTLDDIKYTILAGLSFMEWV